MSVLAKSARILDLVADSPDDRTLTSIAQRARPATIVDPSAPVRAGRARPAVARRRRDYAPGPRLARWGRRPKGSIDIVRIASPTMMRLRDAIGESVHLYVRQRDRRVCVAAVDGNLRAAPLHRGRQAAAAVGRRVGQAAPRIRRSSDAASGASPRRGEAAHASRAEPGRADGSARRRSRRPGGARLVRRARGGPGGRRRADPRTTQRDVVAALSVSGPTARLTAERLDELLRDQGLPPPQISRSAGLERRR